MGRVLRVSDETREQVLRLGREEFGGASAEETVRRLIDEHWQAKAVAAMREYRQTNPHGWADYLSQAEQWAAADAPVVDGWRSRDQ